MKEHYTVLRFVLWTLRVMAGFIALIGVLLFIGAIFIDFGTLPVGFLAIRWAVGFILLVSSTITALMLFAASESIQVVLDIEENTRASARGLAYLVERTKPKPPQA